MATTTELARYLGEMRRAMIREGLLAAVTTLGEADVSMPQIATLVLLDDLGDLTPSALAAKLGRSPSATSRLLDGLVQKGWVTRTEDPADRRRKRVALAPDGRAFIQAFEATRAGAQAAIMADLSDDERAQVLAAFALLARAAARRR